MTSWVPRESIYSAGKLHLRGRSIGIYQFVSETNTIEDLTKISRYIYHTHRPDGDNTEYQEVLREMYYVLSYASVLGNSVDAASPERYEDEELQTFCDYCEAL